MVFFAIIQMAAFSNEVSFLVYTCNLTYSIPRTKKILYYRFVYFLFSKTFIDQTRRTVKINTVIAA